MTDNLEDGLKPSEPLKVTATHWFDLSDRKGRGGVSDNIRGLIGMAMDLQQQQDDVDLFHPVFAFYKAGVAYR
jgi:hypothetical protein